MYVGGCLTIIPAYDGVEMVDCAVSVLQTDRPTNTTITTIATSIQLFNCLAKHVHVKFVAAVWNPALIVLAYSFFFLAKADLPVAAAAVILVVATAAAAVSPSNSAALPSLLFQRWMVSIERLRS